MKLEAICTDLDHSLLNDDKKVGELDLSTIHALKKKGVRFFICTGRPAAFTRDIADKTGLEDPLCCCNGAIIYDYIREKAIWSNESFPTEKVLLLEEYLKSRHTHHLIYTSKYPLFDDPNGKRTLYWTEQVKTWKPENRFKIRLTTDPDIDLRKEEVHKFLIPYVDEAFKKDIQELLPDFEVNWSDKNMLDVNVKGINKGKGVLTLCKLYGLNPANVLALGDNFNDESMLGQVGYPVCPENAEESIKKMACYITTANNQNPLTHAVTHLFPKILD